MNNLLFEQATRRQLRFDSKRGSLTTEQLWDLPLVELNEIAVTLNKKIKTFDEESFITTVKRIPIETQLKFDVCKYIIDVKLKEQEVAKKKAEIRIKREKLLTALSNKEDEKINSMSHKAILKELDSLEQEMEEL